MRRLTMEFQPVFMAGYSLKDHDSSHWERRVRPRAVPQTQATCRTCDFVAEERRLIPADEVWEFSSPPHVALVDLRPLCTRCHEAKDFAQTLVLIAKGARDAKREAEIKRHYCEVNACSEAEFDTDFAAAAATKRALEESYGCNSVPEVDCGDWGRPKDTPRLSSKERELVKAAFEIHGEVFVGERLHRNHSNAVRALQATPLDKRAAILSEIENLLDADDDEDMWPDHECPWDIKMNRE